MDVQCWWCGIEPRDVIEDRKLCSREPDYIYNWPPGDHAHAATPPTPGGLSDLGHQALSRIQAEAIRF